MTDEAVRAMLADEGRRRVEATELLRRWRNLPEGPERADLNDDTDRFLAALAGEDEKPPDPQREGDYL